VQPLLHCDGINLIGRNPIREHRIKVKDCANGFSSVCSISCHHYDAGNTSGAQRLDRPRCLLPQLVGKKERSNGASVDRNEHA
jgi:hypothetical protein